MISINIRRPNTKEGTSDNGIDALFNPTDLEFPVTFVELVAMNSIGALMYTSRPSVVLPSS